MTHHVAALLAELRRGPVIVSVLRSAVVEEPTDEGGGGAAADAPPVATTNVLVPEPVTLAAVAHLATPRRFASPDDRHRVGQVVSEAVAKQLLSRKLLEPEVGDQARKRWDVCVTCDDAPNLWAGGRAVAAAVSAVGGTVRLELAALPVAPPPPGLLDAFSSLGVEATPSSRAGGRSCIFGCGCTSHALVELPANDAHSLAQLMEARRLLGGPPLLPRLRDLGWFLGVREAICCALRAEEVAGFTEFATTTIASLAPRVLLPLTVALDADGGPAASSSVLTICLMLADDVRGRPLTQRLFKLGRSRAITISKSWLHEEQIHKFDDLLTQQLAEACAEPFVLGFGLEVKLRLRANLSDHKMQHIMNVVEAGDSEHRNTYASVGVNSWLVVRDEAYFRGPLQIAAAVRLQQRWRAAVLERHAQRHGEGQQPEEKELNRQVSVLFGGLSKRALAEDRLPLLCAGAAKLGLDLSGFEIVVKVLHDVEKAMSERIHFLIKDNAGVATARWSDGTVRTLEAGSRKRGADLLKATFLSIIKKDTMDGLLARHWGKAIRHFDLVYKPHVPSSVLQLAELHAATLELAYTPVLPTVGCWKVVEWSLLCTQMLFLQHRLAADPAFQGGAPAAPAALEHRAARGAARAASSALRASARCTTRASRTICKAPQSSAAERLRRRHAVEAARAHGDARHVGAPRAAPRRAQTLRRAQADHPTDLELHVAHGRRRLTARGARAAQLRHVLRGRHRPRRRVAFRAARHRRGGSRPLSARLDGGAHGRRAAAGRARQRGVRVRRRVPPPLGGFVGGAADVQRPRARRLPAVLCRRRRGARSGSDGGDGGGGGGGGGARQPRNGAQRTAAQRGVDGDARRDAQPRRGRAHHATAARRADDADGVAVRAAARLRHRDGQPRLQRHRVDRGGRRGRRCHRAARRRADRPRQQERLPAPRVPRRRARRARAAEDGRGGWRRRLPRARADDARRAAVPLGVDRAAATAAAVADPSLLPPPETLPSLDATAAVEPISVKDCRQFARPGDFARHGCKCCGRSSRACNVNAPAVCDFARCKSCCAEVSGGACDPKNHSR